MKQLLLVGALVLAACASAKDDARPRPAREVVTGAGRIRGGGVRMDVTIGHAFGQRPVRADRTRAQQGVVTP